MFTGFGIWLSPLLLLPGAALLILSTSARYAQIHHEIHHLVEQEHPDDLPVILDHLYFRATYFKNALVLLYISVGLFALAGILGAITSQWENISHTLVVSITGAGILSLFGAAYCLIRESIQSLEIIKNHVNKVNEAMKDSHNE